MSSDAPQRAPDPARAAQERAVAEAFDIPGRFVAARPHGSGWINDTLLVEFDDGGRRTRWILQRINTSVFRRPEHVMENVARVTEHQRRALARRGAADADRRALRLVAARAGGFAHVDPDGGWWRAFHYIEATSTHDAVTGAAQAGAAAEAFGRFLADLADLPAPRLHETIPRFHDARARFEQLAAAASADAHGRLAGCRRELDSALAREPLVAKLERLLASGALPERVAHNDTKINNVLFDDATGEAVCVIDLDTAMPGNALYDFGDLARRAATRAPEDERDLARVRVEPALFEALVAGFLRGAGRCLADAERRELVFASQLMTLVIGMRFLADHLAGDVYFRIHRPGQNLDLARTQLALLADFEQRTPALQSIVNREIRG
ncbi:MAG: mucin desulfatase [Proteobacteria bacterium]|nr:MAG: mucin desulfatase [Pseudomonadota bacterium]